MPVELDDILREGDLIHRTPRGEPVRSNSEVIIANLLNSRRVDYVYEQRLTHPDDGSFRYPDITPDDPATGLRAYCEHLRTLIVTSDDGETGIGVRARGR